MSVHVDRAPARGLAVEATTEQVLLAASLFWALAANRPFLSAALKERALSHPSTWLFVLALVVGLVALNWLLLAPFACRWTVKPLVSLLLVATAFAIHFMQELGVYLDPGMLRNVLHTHPGEARELLSLRLVAHLLLYAVLPLALLWRVRIVRRPWGRALLVRSVWVLMALAILAGALLAMFQPLASFIRNQHDARYLITPANAVWSLGRVLVSEAHGAGTPRRSIGGDAVPGPSWSAAARPRLVVLVVGETARAANWGLNGYARQTTPQLASLPVINFTQVSSCGTSTEVSLPCMFAPVGRRDYDETRIRGSESLLHVVARAGVDVQWIDNQGGCKGVCDGLPYESTLSRPADGLCSDGACFDETLLAGIAQRLDRGRGVQLLVLHQLGNHGPGYFRRYPPPFDRFAPACRSDDLQACTQAEIVNAYDNALLYTDHVLATAIRRLQARAGEVDSALVYVSDHGESLGENNLFLHGIPYAIAPDTQKRVPMLMWMSDGFRQSMAIDAGCLQQRATQPAGHDHLFHTLLGLLDVRTALHEPAWDLVHGCRTLAP
ncbi:phosphoethanolamine--lipid A transferase [Piscinibacter sp. XHJ-5]|uniref:phosphoethanolamine transferase n=1 Tax=Piscinibacter sp. XHJ-5 TaxID=3037797 RepID=UPI002452BC05|nr:phosphoethanolamine--lipid A transferase [Piscinibacter sp. XHJ-5]